MRWVSLGVLAAAAAVLRVFWDRIPERWAVHWGMHDRPNGWAQKSVAGAFGPLLMGLAVWVLVEIVVVWMRRQAKHVTPRVAPAYVEVQLGIARVAALAVALLAAALAIVLPLVRPRSSVPMVMGALLGMGVVLGLGLGRAAKQARVLR